MDPTAVGRRLGALDPVGLWRSLPVARQRDFIKAVLEIKVTKIGRGRWHDKLADITITQRSPLHNIIIRRCWRRRPTRWLVVWTRPPYVLSSPSSSGLKIMNSNSAV